MTVEAMILDHKSELTVQVTSILPVEEWNVERNLSAEQVDAIIRAWRGQSVDQVVPISPIGEWDMDGTLSLGEKTVNTPAFITGNTSCHTNNWTCPILFR